MNLREAIDLVIADTREGMGEPEMSTQDAINLAYEADMGDVTAVVEDPDVVEAYRTVFTTDRGEVDTALASQPAPAAADEQVDAAMRACDEALTELDHADTAQTEQDRAAELARRAAADQAAEADTGLDREV